MRSRTCVFLLVLGISAALCLSETGPYVSGRAAAVEFRDETRGDIVEYDPATGRETVTRVCTPRSTVPTGERAEAASTGTRSGSLLPPWDSRRNFTARDGTTLTKISEPYTAPFKTICKIKATFPGGHTAPCTGAFIGSYHVLTAGHCVYNTTQHQNGWGWADEISIWPAQTDVVDPVSNSLPYRMRSSW